MSTGRGNQTGYAAGATQCSMPGDAIHLVQFNRFARAHLGAGIRFHDQGHRRLALRGSNDGPKGVIRGHPNHYELAQKSPNLHAKRTQIRAKWRKKCATNPFFDGLMRNSPPTAALVREILFSHSMRIHEMLVNLSQRITKLPTNANRPNGRSQANIWLFWAAQIRTSALISMGFMKISHLSRKNRTSSTKSHAPLIIPRWSARRPVAALRSWRESSPRASSSASRACCQRPS